MAKVIFETVETVAKVYEIDIEELKDLLVNDCFYEDELPTDTEELVDLFVEKEGTVYLTPEQEELEEEKVTYVEVEE